MNPYLLPSPDYPQSFLRKLRAAICLILSSLGTHVYMQEFLALF
jgi:hypothetical protein